MPGGPRWIAVARSTFAGLYCGSIRQMVPRRPRRPASSFDVSNTHQSGIVSLGSPSHGACAPERSLAERTPCVLSE